TVEGRGTQRWELLFYLGPLLVFALLSSIVVTTGSGTLFTVSHERFAHDLRWVGYLLLLPQLIVIAWVLSKQRSVGIVERAAWFGDQRFEELVKRRNFEEVLKASRYAHALRENETVSR